MGLRCDAIRYYILSSLMSQDWQDRFRVLRQSFESLAIQSKGLFHVMVEQKSGRWVPRILDDAYPPWLQIGGPPVSRWSVLGTETLPGKSAYPRALSPEESAAVAGTEDERHIKDGSGRVHAIWEPSIVRRGYIAGDRSVSQQFNTLSEAAGHALQGLPDAAIKVFPEDIRTLARPRTSCDRRYWFGDVPYSPLPLGSLCRGWQPGALAFADGVVVDSPEPGDRSDKPSIFWHLLLHRLGWTEGAGTPVVATRWFWNKNVTVPYQETPYPTGSIPELAKIMETMPAHRFYSVLGRSDTDPTDLCFASAWAIDYLVNLWQSKDKNTAIGDIRDSIQILERLFEFGKSMERLPSTYEGKNEEALRDLLLVHLAPGFDSVTGETFNKIGKTDILVRHEKENIFVAECKFWSGEKNFLATIDQCLGYLTWRDSKAAIINFIPNRNLQPVLDQVIAVIPKHNCYVGGLDFKKDGWVECDMRLPNDSTRSVRLAVLSFHLPID
jgi:hypothetical protein